MSFTIRIQIENSTGSWTVGPISSELTERCDTRSQAHYALERILQAHLVEIETEAQPGMGSVQDGPLV